MEKIKLNLNHISNTDSEEGFFEWFIMKGITDYFEKNKKDPFSFTSELSIEFKINGKDILIREIVEEIHHQLNQMIAAKAKQLLEDRFQQMNNNIYQLQEHVSRACLALEEQVSDIENKHYGR